MPNQIHTFLPMSYAPSQSNIFSMTTSSITIRPAYADDQLAIQRLAELDSRLTPPPSPLLVAEVDGELRAALSLSDGTAIADPFVLTATTIALMRQHAKELVPASASRFTGRLGAWWRARHGFGDLQGAGAPSA